MSPLTPEEMDDLRKEMASLAISDASKNELIHIIDNIVISFVDQAHGLGPVQLSLSSRANKHFQIPTNMLIGSNALSMNSMTLESPGVQVIQNQTKDTSHDKKDKPEGAYSLSR